MRSSFRDLGGGEDRRGDRGGGRGGMGWGGIGVRPIWGDRGLGGSGSDRFRFFLNGTMIQWGDGKTIEDPVIPMPSIMSWHGVTAGRTSSRTMPAAGGWWAWSAP